MKPYCRDTWIEVDLDAIGANVLAFREHIPPSSAIMAVVKADGYGHGAVHVGRAALESGAASLAVAMLDEAIVLRRAGITAPILVLGYTPVESVDQAAEWNVALTVYHAEWIEQVTRRLQHADSLNRLAVHVKVDTGMGRLGVRSEAELLAVVEAVERSHELSWEGIFTHFACADEPDTAHVEAQHRRFRELLDGLRARGYALPQVHCCNSAAATAFPEWGYDAIRLGISLYGLSPSAFLREQGQVRLTPALSLKTRIAHVKTAEQPMTISYGATYTAAPGEQIATLPIGYADGFSRLLSNRGTALHNGRRVPIVGRVCMDQTMVRIEAADASVGDEVVLYGQQQDERITLDEVAELLGTINYEVACMLNYRIPRVYLKGNQVVDFCHRIHNKC
ncbi:alanine racemase [Brevibacillus humidisoli]|uniref:alanine racemase n=1 Tax=Brevibacillus humidisoli TaxID=2895522 RepID=UPI001E4B7649|nr:alanine racemase [Brevibacillus humidisoli]UFJ40944.1 alanine racemase [Brevibacillus humidisoli]